MTARKWYEAFETFNLDLAGVFYEITNGLKQKIQGSSQLMVKVKNI